MQISNVHGCINIGLTQSQLQPDKHGRVRLSRRLHQNKMSLACQRIQFCCLEVERSQRHIVLEEMKIKGEGVRDEYMRLKQKLNLPALLAA